jgi:CRP-like cAMP-binding protein
MLSLEALLPISSLADFRKNQHFYQPEDRSQAVYMLIKGRVHLYRINPDGKKRRRLSSTESVDFRIQMIHEATRRNTKGKFFLVKLRVTAWIIIFWKWP